MYVINSKEKTDKILAENGFSTGRGKYPWDSIEVGQSFHLPRNQMTRENFRPGIPAAQKAMGRVWKTKCNMVQDGVIGTLVVREA
jgi:hypothetical protein